MRRTTAQLTCEAGDPHTLMDFSWADLSHWAGGKTPVGRDTQFLRIVDGGNNTSANLIDVFQ